MKGESHEKNQLAAHGGPDVLAPHMRVRADGRHESAGRTNETSGHVIVFRHGATHRDQADTDPLNHDNVAKQRLLSESGREVAKQVADSFALFHALPSFIDPW